MNYIYIYICVCICHELYIYIYIYIYEYMYVYVLYKQAKLATSVEGDSMVPFSIATSSRCRRGC